MEYQVELVEAVPQRIAAVRVSVMPGGVGKAWRPALDQVWQFLRGRDDLRSGHNLFLYHHAGRIGAPMAVEFGVEVDRDFVPQGNVRCVLTPAGQVVRVLHVGPIDGLAGAHWAISEWSVAEGRKLGSASWEIYGDWGSDPARHETCVTWTLE